MFYGRDTFSPAGFDDGCACPNSDGLVLGRFSFEGDPERKVSYRIFSSDGLLIIGFIRLIPKLDILSGADISFYVFKEHRRRVYAEEVAVALIDEQRGTSLRHNHLDHHLQRRRMDARTRSKTRLHGSRNRP